MIELTAEQTAVVNHNEGPALVFAVAGAGKTTAMVHRIERLVREQIFPAQRILATSFARANVADLQRALAPWPHCRPVDTRTLHSLGRDVIVRAQRQGYVPHLRLDNGGKSADQLDHHILNRALGLARQRGADFVRELDSIDRADFLDYVGACKARLAFADLRRAALSAEAKQIAQQAQAPDNELAWYLPLYQLFEEVRLQHGWVTFDDMLLTGWQVLLDYPAVLAAVQADYHCVLVDEFQDVNRAQVEMLELVTRERRNYMAIGDDDQTIYEWRGADPSFILKFPERYRATRYLISDNFRCPPAPLALANRLIGHNKQRQRKRLHLTQGFRGETAVFLDEDAAAMGQRIVGKIRELHAAGRPFDEMAILVRLHAQTPYIEQALIAAEIPYHTSRPFYARPEIKTLIHYCRLAWLEHRARESGRFLGSAAMQQSFENAWENVCNRPKRYISFQLRDQIRTAVVRHGRTLIEALDQACQAVQEDWLLEKLDYLLADLRWLADSLEQPAANVLRELDARLAYRHFLRESSGFPQTGEGRALSVEVFIQYAQDFAGESGTLLAFMGHISDLRQQKIGQTKQKAAVALATIHKAKGLEWPVVFVPQLNAEILPFKGEETDNLEEERRLLYVALTRSRAHLYLCATQDEPLSPFLKETGWKAALSDLQELEATLARDAQTWRAADACGVARHVKRYQLGRYFAHWWPRQEDARRVTAVAHAMQRFYASLEEPRDFTQLGLDPQAADLWREIASLASPGAPLPGLEELRTRDKREKRRRRTSTPPQVTAGSLGARLAGVVAAGQMPVAQAIPQLVRALADPAVSVRTTAVTRLQAIGGEETVEAMAELLTTGKSNGRVQEAARQVLDGLVTSDDEAAAVRRAAAQALARQA